MTSVHEGVSRQTRVDRQSSHALNSYIVLFNFSMSFIHKFYVAMESIYVQFPEIQNTIHTRIGEKLDFLFSVWCMVYAEGTSSCAYMHVYLMVVKIPAIMTNIYNFLLTCFPFAIACSECMKDGKLPQA